MFFELSTDCASLHNLLGKNLVDKKRLMYRSKMMVSDFHANFVLAATRASCTVCGPANDGRQTPDRDERLNGGSAGGSSDLCDTNAMTGESRILLGFL